MKKTLTALLCGVLGIIAVFGAACSGGNLGGTGGGGNTGGNGGNSGAPLEDMNGEVLVVYFSAQGHTESVAEYISEATGGDLFELVPENPYTEEDLNYGNENSRVSREHNDESLRDVALVSETVENWDEYEIVFIGYPIWWGIAAWPVNRFITGNDFTGKTVVPFCTSVSTGLGDSAVLLEEKAGTGNWHEGMGFSSYVQEETVVEWINELGLSS